MLLWDVPKGPARIRICQREAGRRPLGDRSTINTHWDSLQGMKLGMSRTQERGLDRTDIALSLVFTFLRSNSVPSSDFKPDASYPELCQVLHIRAAVVSPRQHCM